MFNWFAFHRYTRSDWIWISSNVKDTTSRAIFHLHPLLIEQLVKTVEKELLFAGRHCLRASFCIYDFHGNFRGELLFHVLSRTKIELLRKLRFVSVWKANFCVFDFHKNSASRLNRNIFIANPPAVQLGELDRCILSENIFDIWSNNQPFCNSPPKEAKAHQTSKREIKTSSTSAELALPPSFQSLPTKSAQLCFNSYKSPGQSLTKRFK